MTSSRLLKAFALLSLLCASAAVWSWHSTHEWPDHWLVRIAVTSFLLTFVLGLVNPDTRPRMMLRFLAALFALCALMSFAADISRPASGEASRGALSLLHHLQTLAPAFVISFQHSVEHSIGEFAWNPVLTSILSLPASWIFFLLAVGAGFLGRPRQRVRVFANDY
ncbi:hypothetical protein [Hyphomicrobium sp.]|jgi:hypothetical protein|uniref:hypothetical protein n=1 Tax=Hyphomicrobium sp. TaxID=82 RepID=UPI002CEEA6CC|nr:hypothetical protein [Hyphomicrobium sp.]HVZ05670.1 hypothetical protein [Hyphomicrobium sp.]